MNGANVLMTQHLRDDDEDVKELEQLIEEVSTLSRWS